METLIGVTTMNENANVDLQVIILAGGKGIRMGSIEKQKCMLLVDGVPILEHILRGIQRSFGSGAKVIIATGFKGKDVQSYFGTTYEGMKLIYVHDDEHLETKGRLLLAKELLTKPFLFLAGDVLTPDDVFLRVVNRYEEEQRSKKRKVIGVISGAVDHSPALTHAVLTVQDGYLQDIAHPPPDVYDKSHLRETHRAVYSLEFLDFALRSKQKLLSRLIHELIKETDNHFGVESFEGPWGHYVSPEDLIRYQNLPFLRHDS